MSAPEKASPEESETAWKKGKDQYRKKRNSEYFDPCQEAADKSLKCLRRNGGDRTMCTDFFDAYRDCKKSWMEEMKQERIRKGGSSWF